MAHYNFITYSYLSTWEVEKQEKLLLKNANTEESIQHKKHK